MAKDTVAVGDLVAIRWSPDPEWSIGVVQYDKTVHKGDVEFAHDVIKLMDADKFQEMVEECSQRLFDPVLKEFPMVKTGDFPPDATFTLDFAIQEAVSWWLHWNYPRELLKAKASHMEGE